MPLLWLALGSVTGASAARLRPEQIRKVLTFMQQSGIERALLSSALAALPHPTLRRLLRLLALGEGA